MKSLLSTLIAEDTSSWNDIFNKMLELNKDHTGRVFEEFCKYYYLAVPYVLSEYKHVWLFSEIPTKVKERLGLGKIDHGVDLVLEDHDGLYSVVQCKFKTEQNSNISWTKDKIANMFADGDKADFFIVFTNASGLDKHYLTKKAID